MFDWDINLLAVIVAVAVHQALGFLWYGPLFGRLWLESTGKTREELGNPTSSILTALMASLVTALALALLVNMDAGPDIGKGLAFGALAGIGFAATTEATASAFEGRNATVTWLYVSYQVIGLVVMGAILGALG